MGRGRSDPERTAIVSKGRKQTLWVRIDARAMTDRVEHSTFLVGFKLGAPRGLLVQVCHGASRKVSTVLQLDDDTLPPQWQSNRSVRNFFTDRILATMPLGSAAYEAERTASGEVRIWLAADVVTSSVPCVGRAKATATSFCGWRPMASRANAQRPDQTARLSKFEF
jgi:hypothetical protein